MTLALTVDGRAVNVVVQPLGVGRGVPGRYRVTITPHGGGAARVLELDADPTAVGVLLRFDDGRVVDAAVTRQSAGVSFVQAGPAEVEVVSSGSGRARGERAQGSDAPHVTAPMPGRVVRVLVKPGDAVALRQGLVVVEAMKMENELAAPAVGRVRDVLVHEGESVQAGRLLVILDAASR